MLDRDLQRELLTKLREAYPEFLDLSTHERFKETDLHKNAFYLVEHGLVEPVAQRIDVMGAPSMIFTARITAQGLDFLEEDGGLSAMLGTVTVRLAPDTLKALLEARVDASALPAAEKATLKSKIRQMAGTAVEKVFWKLFEEMLKRSDVAIDVMTRWS
ncbi:MAG: hypothetical protein ACREAA_16305 [Candidatus Polarisedimenticolia bacterium]